MDKLKIIILQTSCVNGNIRVKMMIEKCINKLGLNAIVVDGDYGNLRDWDSQQTVVISPTPLVIELKSKLLIVPTAYVGLMREEEFKREFCRILNITS